MSKDKAQENAADAVRELIDDIVTDLFEKGEAETNINARTYGRTGEEMDQGWSDDWYNPTDAVAVLEELGDEGIDSGLYEGCDWRKMLSIMAGEAVRMESHNQFQVLIEEINDLDIDELKDEAKAELKAAKRDELRKQAIAALKDDDDTEPDDEAIDEKIDELFDEWIDEGDAEYQKKVEEKIAAKVKETADAFHK